MMIPIISFIGSSGSGKTNVLEKVVTELKRRSIRVAVIKHSHHDAFEFDKDGKDSQRYNAAGAETVIVSGPQELMLTQKTGRDLSIDEVTRLIDPDIDLILTEGFKNAATPKIEVHRKVVEPKLLAEPEQLLAVITDEPLDIKVPQFDASVNNTVALTDLIERWLSDQPEKEIVLFVNKKPVPLNPFVRDFMTRTLKGMFSSLKGVSRVKNFQVFSRDKS
ncbi:MAG: molybdopterin-guanine dinucleotide biosynthesis protein B [Dehalococcoidales bacterium]|nr:molybdopterin-guanine dinucleotide biosynthesis protein B [Dehalococcoidales bacterium]